MKEQFCAKFFASAYPNRNFQKFRSFSIFGSLTKTDGKIERSNVENTCNLPKCGYLSSCDKHYRCRVLFDHQQRLLVSANCPCFLNHLQIDLFVGVKNADIICWLFVDCVLTVRQISQINQAWILYRFAVLLPSCSNLSTDLKQKRVR